jgi:DNA-binding NarL/FixJ family response regulator
VSSPDQLPIRVVLADDTRDIRLLLALALELAGGFEVVGEAADGNEAIAQASVHQPDILLLDLAMPVLDGLQALPHIRELAPESLVVVLSGFGAEAMGEEAVRLGATTYVQKGVNPTELAEQLRALVRDRTAAQGGP